MIAWTDYETGEHRIACPSCGRGGRDKTAGLTMELDGNGVVHCFRCAYTGSHHPERGIVRRALRQRSHEFGGQRQRLRSVKGGHGGQRASSAGVSQRG